MIGISGMKDWNKIFKKTRKKSEEKISCTPFLEQNFYQIRCSKFSKKLLNQAEDRTHTNSFARN